MIKKNILWFSEISPEYQTENVVLKRIQGDKKMEIKNIQHAFQTNELALEDSKTNKSNALVFTKDSVPEQLFRESYFADAVAVSKAIFKNTLFPEHIKDIHCPIVVFPEKQEEIDHLLFIITSNPDSVISIKQFCCLFQDICKKTKITLLVFDDGEGIQKPDEQVLVNYLKKWNKNLGVYKIQFWESEMLTKYLEFNERTLTVMNLDLLLASKADSFPQEIFDRDDTTLFIGYNY